MGILQHLLVLGALIVNLWVGGDLVEGWLGGYGRAGFELTLILGYMRFVLKFPSPFRGRRRRDP